MKTIALTVLLFALLGADALPAEDVRRVIANLGGEKFAAREAAQQQLLKFAESDHKAVLAACVSAYRQARDPEVKTRLHDVMERVVDKYLFRAPRGYLGARLNNVNIVGGQLVVQGLTMPAGAVWVSQVVEDTGAAKAGLQANDFIIGVDGKRWEGGVDKFIAYVQSKRPGERLKLSVVRNDTTNSADAVLGELPAEQAERVYTKERGAEFFEQWLKEQTGENKQ